MKNINPESFPEQFSEDPQENLRIENEILHLTIKAEMGGELVHNTQVPPEVENEFLKNIIAFEHAFAHSRQIKIYDLLNKPSFKKAGAMSDEELPVALEAMMTLLEEKNIVVEYRADYNDRLKYTFITDELFENEMADVQIQGMVTHFCYEEFHPNHKIDIEDSAIQFISNWFEHHIDVYKWSLSGPFILPDGRNLSNDEVVAKIKHALDAFVAFKDYDYDISNIHFELLAETGTGVGHAEGTIKYTAVLESGDEMEVSGNFKLFMCREYDCWYINFFVFPGFGWD